VKSPPKKLSRNIRAVTSGYAVSLEATNPTRTPRAANGRALAQSTTVSAAHVAGPRCTPPRSRPVISTTTTTGRAITMEAAVLVVT
jgi:hypothetical protein